MNKNLNRLGVSNDVWDCPSRWPTAGSLRPSPECSRSDLELGYKNWNLQRIWSWLYWDYCNWRNTYYSGRVRLPPKLPQTIRMSRSLKVDSLCSSWWYRTTTGRVPVHWHLEICRPTWSAFQFLRKNNGSRCETSASSTGIRQRQGSEKAQNTTMHWHSGSGTSIMIRKEEHCGREVWGDNDNGRTTSAVTATQDCKCNLKKHHGTTTTVNARLSLSSSATVGLGLRNILFTTSTTKLIQVSKLRRRNVQS